MSIPDPSRPRWFQFSLRSLLLFSAITALIMASAISLRRAREAEQEVRVLRRETGQLTVDDPTQIYVKKIATSESMTWHWRIHLPEGHKYQLCSKLGTIPRVGLGIASTQSLSLRPGVHRITVSIHRNYLNEWEWTMSEPTVSGATIVPEADATWLPVVSSYGVAQAGAVIQIESPPDAPLALLRLTTFDDSGEGKQGTNAASAPAPPPPGPDVDGILVWLDPEPTTKP